MYLCVYLVKFQNDLSVISPAKLQVVFSEPVKLDGAWTPIVIPKSEEERSEIAAVLQRNILFAAMDDDQRRILIDAMASAPALATAQHRAHASFLGSPILPQTRKEFDENVAIISQGDPGDYYYILTDGTAEILVNGRKVLQVWRSEGCVEWGSHFHQSYHRSCAAPLNG